MINKCSLGFMDLRLDLHLGVTALERSKKQTVLLTVKITFAKPPRACITDDVGDTICYDALIQKIKKFCSGKEFAVMEYLGAQLFSLIKKDIYKDCKLSLRIAKQNPLPDLPQSVFEIGD